MKPLWSTWYRNETRDSIGIPLFNLPFPNATTNYWKCKWKKRSQCSHQRQAFFESFSKLKIISFVPASHRGMEIRRPSSSFRICGNITNSKWKTLYVPRGGWRTTHFTIFDRFFALLVSTRCARTEKMLCKYFVLLPFPPERTCEQDEQWTDYGWWSPRVVVNWIEMPWGEADDDGANDT